MPTKGKIGPRPGGHRPMGRPGRSGGFYRRPVMPPPPRYSRWGYGRGCFPRLWGCLVPIIVALLVVGGVLIAVL